MLIKTIDLYDYCSYRKSARINKFNEELYSGVAKLFFESGDFTHFVDYKHTYAANLITDCFAEYHEKYSAEFKIANTSYMDDFKYIWTGKEGAWTDQVFSDGKPIPTYICEIINIPGIRIHIPKAFVKDNNK